MGLSREARRDILQKLLEELVALEPPEDAFRYDILDKDLDQTDPLKARCPMITILVREDFILGIEPVPRIPVRGVSIDWWSGENQGVKEFYIRTPSSSKIGSFDRFVVNDARTARKLHRTITRCRSALKAWDLLYRSEEARKHRAQEQTTARLKSLSQQLLSCGYKVEVFPRTGRIRIEFERTEAWFRLRKEGPGLVLETPLVLPETSPDTLDVLNIFFSHLAKPRMEPSTDP
jgi:hypothetical protein